jgi:hypothetical protein
MSGHTAVNAVQIPVTKYKYVIVTDMFKYLTNNLLSMCLRLQLLTSGTRNIPEPEFYRVQNILFSSYFYITFYLEKRGYIV